MSQQFILHDVVQRLELRHEVAMEVDAPTHNNIMYRTAYVVKAIFDTALLRPSELIFSREALRS